MHVCETSSLTLSKNVSCGCLRRGCGGEYLGLRGTREQGSEENYIIRSLTICTAHQVQSY